MSKASIVVLALVLLVSIVASSSFGYLVGSDQTRSFQSAIVALNQTKTVTATVTTPTSGSLPSGSVPVLPSPFEDSVNIRGSSSTWYVPIIFLGQGSRAQLYVNYHCDGPCSSGNTSISSLGITASLPEGFSISGNGVVTPTSNLSFSSASIVEIENTSETLLYTVSVSYPGVGYYTFSLPYGCLLEPVIYVKAAGSNYDYAPITSWLQASKASSMNCSDRVQVTILGFTNSYYTEIPLQLSSAR